MQDIKLWLRLFSLSLPRGLGVGLRAALPLGIAAAALCGPARTQGAWAQGKILVLDDFEDGVGKWTRNDKGKTLNPSAPVVLVDVLATRPSVGGPRGSSNAGLFTFKAARDSWASASLKINGRDWAKIGATSLKFWLNADGQSPGVDLLLRGTARNADGSTRDVAYQPTDPQSKQPVPVKLSTRHWREVAIPLERFRDKDGASALRNLSGLYLLQFVQRGTWNSRFFTIDDLILTGSGTSFALASDTSSPASTSTTQSPASSPTPAADPDAVSVEIDYLRRAKNPLGRIRASANISVGQKLDADGAPARPFENAAFVGAMKKLAPNMVRVEAGNLVELVDSSRPSFDFSALQAASRGARAVGAEPLISLSAPASWGLDAAGYAAYAAQAARALNQGTSRGPRRFELSLGSLPSAQAVAFYRAAYTSLKAMSKGFQVGGIGTGNPDALRLLIASAPGLDFLSIPFHGANEGTPEMDTLINATLSLPSLKAAARLLDASKFRLAPLYITRAGLNGARNEAGDPQDKRLDSMAASAWWSSFLLNGSRLGDQFFYESADSADWGLLNAQGNAFPPYYALYLWNAFCPEGSQRVPVKVSGDAHGLQILGVNTPTAHNALFVNTSSEPQSVRLTIRGFPVLRQARIRVLQEPLDPAQGITFTELPKSPFQSFKLPPYSTAVLQFIEPPTKAPAKSRTRSR